MRMKVKRRWRRNNDKGVESPGGEIVLENKLGKRRKKLADNGG